MCNKFLCKSCLLPFIILLCGCASTRVGVETAMQKAQDKEIVVEEGVFLLRNLSMAVERFSPKLKGDIINNTTKDWNEVVFVVELYDQSGNKLKKGRYTREDFTFKIHYIKRGETQSIGMGYGKSFIGIRDAIISRYDISFKSGEYPAKYFFKMIKPTESIGLNFEDSFIDIQFSISKKQLRFVLKNKTGNPIKIDWNQVSYVDVLGESHKVMHSGVKYIDRDKIYAPTVIPPSAKIEDIVFPSGYVYYKSGKYGGWRKVPLFPKAPEAKLYKGMTFSVFMPLQINEAVKNYLFTFHIEDVKL